VEWQVQDCEKVPPLSRMVFQVKEQNDEVWKKRTGPQFAISVSDQSLVTKELKAGQGSKKTNKLGFSNRRFMRNIQKTRQAKVLPNQTYTYSRFLYRIESILWSRQNHQPKPKLGIYPCVLFP